MELTKLEREILNHRLEVPDVICGVLCEGEELESYHPEDVEAVIDRLLQGDTSGASKISEAITNDVLRDCIEGSTYYAAAKTAGSSDQKLSAILKAGQSLADKIQTFVGFLYDDKKIEFPDY